MVMRPSGVTKTMKPTSSSHQFTGVAHDDGRSSATTLFSSASQTTHCMPVSVANGNDAATCASSVRRDTGVTTRVSTAAGGSSSSRYPASDPNRGWSYRSATVTSG